MTLAMFAAENIYETHVDSWHDKDDTKKTYTNFRKHFEKAAKGFNRKLTAQKADFKTGESDAATKTEKQPPMPKKNVVATWQIDNTHSQLV